MDEFSSVPFLHACHLYIRTNKTIASMFWMTAFIDNKCCTVESYLLQRFVRNSGGPNAFIGIISEVHTKYIKCDWVCFSCLCDNPSEYKMIPFHMDAIVFSANVFFQSFVFRLEWWHKFSEILNNWDKRFQNYMFNVGVSFSSTENASVENKPYRAVFLFFWRNCVWNQFMSRLFHRLCQKQLCTAEKTMATFNFLMTKPSWYLFSLISEDLPKIYTTTMRIHNIAKASMEFDASHLHN